MYIPWPPISTTTLQFVLSCSPHHFYSIIYVYAKKTPNTMLHCKKPLSWTKGRDTLILFITQCNTSTGVNNCYYKNKQYFLTGMCPTLFNNGIGIWYVYLVPLCVQKDQLVYFVSSTIVSCEWFVWYTLNQIIYLVMFCSHFRDSGDFHFVTQMIYICKSYLKFIHMTK